MLPVNQYLGAELSHHRCVYCYSTKLSGASDELKTSQWIQVPENLALTSICNTILWNPRMKLGKSHAIIRCRSSHILYIAKLSGRRPNRKGTEDLKYGY